MPHNINQGVLADGLTGQVNVGPSVATYSLTNPAGQRVNVYADVPPVALTTDGTTPVVGGAGTQIAVGVSSVVVTLPLNATLKLVSQRAGLVVITRAP